MRLIIRVKNSGSKIQHLAQRNINQGLASRTDINPFSDEQESFQLSYLVTHNTKVIRANFKPTNFETQQLIKFISNLININEEYLILKIHNKYYNHHKNIQGNILGQKPNSVSNKALNQVHKKVQSDTNYGGLDFTQTSIKLVRLVKGFKLSTFNIDIQQQENKQQKQATIKTLQIQADILQAYYNSKQYKHIITQNKVSQARMTMIMGNVKDKFQSVETIQQEDEDDDDQKCKKVQDFKLQQYKMDDIYVSKKTYDPTIAVCYGQLLRIRTPPLKNHLYYYVIDPYQGNFKQFQSKQKYPNHPHQMFSLNFILSPNDIQKVCPKDISWHMKKDLHYFTIEFTANKKKQTFRLGCSFQQTVNMWINAIRQSLQKWDDIRRNPKMIINLVKNDKIIMDRMQNAVTLKKQMSLQHKSAFQNVITQINHQQLIQDNDDALLPIPTGPLCGFAGNVEEKPTEQKIIQQQKKGFFKKSESKTSTSSSDQKDKKDSVDQKQQQSHSIKLSDFKFLKQLGQGAFGQVFLGECLKNKKLYALKAFKKKKLIMNKQIKFAISQISILKQISHPFVISLHFTFQTPNYIYLGLDFCGGKDMSHHLIQEVNFHEEECKFYAAQLVLALEYLHGLDIIYRDLKPQNILLDQQGHLRIIDFGLSKQADNNFAKSFCGSPAYISPQMLKKNGVGKQCDFFSLGAVIYQMIVGEPPFYSQDIKELYDNIANAKLKFPKMVSQKARSLLQGLLRKNPKTRLGSNGFNEIKNHEFFKGLNWQKILKKQIKAPKRVAIQAQQEKDENDIQTQLLKVLHQDFDYTEATTRINRFKNFSFVRQNQFQ